MWPGVMAAGMGSVGVGGCGFVSLRGARLDEVRGARRRAAQDVAGGKALAVHPVFAEEFHFLNATDENRSAIMTSNRPLEDWGHLLADVPTAGAILDRFLHHARPHIAITGRSYRVKDSPTLRNQGRKPSQKPGPDASPSGETP